MCSEPGLADRCRTNLRRVAINLPDRHSLSKADYEAQCDKTRGTAAMNGKIKPMTFAILAVVVTGVSGCAERIRTHGYMPPESDLQQITPGIDTRATVEEIVGVPNASGVLNNSGYYYIESQVRNFGWQRPKVVDREVLAITFDDAGVVDNIVTYGLEDGRVVPITRRVTRSSDGDISFIRKLFGNIGGLNLGGLLGDQ
jgi:outer membrane protein assembly factor BamE (lipoprotein component of BamABCDE complex)